MNRILIAGVGNSWLQDDGFGGEVVKRLNAGAVPEGCTVIDFGVGGLDLAYEVMHGWDALILLDVSRQGGDPGTLYVMEPDQATIDGGIDEGTMINPHGMDPHTVLRFVKSLGAWPGKVVVIACEPLEVEEMGLGLSEPVSAAVDAAVELTLETVADIRATPEPALPSRPPQVPAN